MESSQFGQSPTTTTTTTTAAENATTQKKRKSRFDSPSPVPVASCPPVGGTFKSRSLPHESQLRDDVYRNTDAYSTVDQHQDQDHRQHRNHHRTSSPLVSRTGAPYTVDATTTTAYTTTTTTTSHHRISPTQYIPGSGDPNSSKVESTSTALPFQARNNGHGSVEHPSSGVPTPHPLEVCNVGLMATVLRNHMSGGSEFVPYSAVPSTTEVPRYTMPTTISEIANNRVIDFYDELEELLDSVTPYITPDEAAAFNYSRRKHLNVNKYRSVPTTVLSEQDLLHNRDSCAYRDGFTGRFRPNSGFSPAQRGSGGVTDHAGLGSFTRAAVDDAFESFRKKRATQYHENLAIKDSVRRDSSVMVLSSQAICFKCNRPGHHARDCRHIPT